MEADMGGTNIYTTLGQMVYNSNYGSSDKTILNVFLLTDGEDDAEPIIKLIQNNNKAETRIYTLGIGQGCNQYLIKQMADVGNGRFHLASDTEDINSKIIDLLEDSLTPYLKAFKLDTNAINISSIIPNPESIVSLKKNQELTIQILFSSQQDQENIQFNINCFDSQDQKPINYSVNLNLNQSQDNEYFHKLAAHKFITYYENAVKYGQQQVNFIKLNKKHLDVIDIVNLSVENQILSNKTAFVCEICELEDQFKQQASSKVIIELPKRLPTVNSQINYNNFPYQPMLLGMSAPQIPNQPNCIKMCMSAPKKPDPPKCLDMCMTAPKIPGPPSCFNIPIQQNMFEELIYMSASKIPDPPRQPEPPKQSPYYSITFPEKSEQKLTVIKDEKLSYEQLIQFAQADGSFKISNAIQLTINFFNLNNEQGLKDDVWNTMLVLLYLEKYCNEDKKSWQLIFSKGMAFLLKNGINYMEKKLGYQELQA